MMFTRPSLSIAVICLNNADLIDGCITACTFADEVCIVDGGSSDGSWEKLQALAKELAQFCEIKLQQHRWGGHFGDQRNRSFAMCSKDWIMRVDTDELPSRQVVDGVYSILTGLSTLYDGVRVKQMNLYPDREHYAANLGGWETHARIFRRDVLPDSPWMGHVHEYVPVVEHCTCDWNVNMIHSGWLDPDEYRRKEDFYRAIPGSGFTSRGSLVDRHYEVRDVPPNVRPWPGPDLSKVRSH